jgi:hypothetical protein
MARRNSEPQIGAELQGCFLCSGRNRQGLARIIGVMLDDTQLAMMVVRLITINSAMGQADKACHQVDHQAELGNQGCFDLSDDVFTDPISNDEPSAPLLVRRFRPVT